MVSLITTVFSMENVLRVILVGWGFYGKISPEVDLGFMDKTW